LLALLAIKPKAYQQDGSLMIANPCAKTNENPGGGNTLNVVPPTPTPTSSGYLQPPSTPTPPVQTPSTPQPTMTPPPPTATPCQQNCKPE
jgi:hypothetical protein